MHRKVASDKEFRWAATNGPDDRSSMPSAQDDLSTKVRVRNFGPIADGEIDVRPLTVFVGPSNTGKSWLAVLLYALQKSLRAPGSYISGDDMDAMDEWLAAPAADRNAAMPSHVVEHLAGYKLRSIPKDVCAHFGVRRPGALIREGEEEAEVALSLQGEGMDYRWRISAESDAQEPELDVQVADGVVAGFRDRFLELHEDSGKNGHASDACGVAMPAGHEGWKHPWLGSLWKVVHELYATTCRPWLDAEAHYLPAGRTGLMQTYPSIVRSLIKDAARFSGSFDDAPEDSKKRPGLSNVTADFLHQIVGLNPSELGQEREYRRGNLVFASGGLGGDALERFEKRIIKGKISIDQANPVFPHFLYTPEGWGRALSVMRVSSMVSELAPVALYLQHLVLPGDMLVLEEPEAHLHPDAQVEFVNEIACWVEQGVRVVITTHSEWVLEAVANIVDRPRPSKQAKNPPPSLPEKSVGVWFFRASERKRGSVVSELPLNAETGLYKTGFSKIADALHNEWAVKHNDRQARDHDARDAA